MKSLIISIIITSSLSFSTQAASNKHNNFQKSISDRSNQSSLSQLLNLYYDVKNALVNSDPNITAVKAGEFANAINKIEMKNLSGSDMNIFMSYQTKLTEDATSIAATKDIKLQRNHFSSFSVNMFAFIKALKLNTQSVYYDYCPMQKAYWLSSESTIKNPYFGSAMLTCGKTTETLK